MDLEDVTNDDGGSACKVNITCIWNIYYAFSEILLLSIRLIVVLSRAAKKEERKGQRNQEKNGCTCK